MPPVAPVRNVLCRAVVVEVAALAEGGQVVAGVVGSIPVEVGNGEDDFCGAAHPPPDYLIVEVWDLFFHTTDIYGDVLCRALVSENVFPVRRTAPLAAPVGFGADLEGEGLPVWGVVLLSYRHVLVVFRCGDILPAGQAVIGFAQRLEHCFALRIRDVVRQVWLIELEDEEGEALARKGVCHGVGDLAQVGAVWV